MAEKIEVLAGMQYSGRGIALGMTKKGNPFVGYTLTGRSPPSQARRLSYDLVSFCIRTEVTDPAQLEKGNPALLIYPAIAFFGEKIIASNGAQTNLLKKAIVDVVANASLKDILDYAFSSPVIEGGIDITSYEPDAPNYTPRISGILDRKSAAFYTIRKVADKKNLHGYAFDLEPGKARLITTYKGGNENPLLPFEGSPLEFDVRYEGSQEICEALYESIGPKGGNNYRVASAVVLKNGTGLEVFVINRNERGS